MSRPAIVIWRLPAADQGAGRQTEDSNAERARGVEQADEFRPKVQAQQIEIEQNRVDPAEHGKPEERRGHQKEAYIAVEQADCLDVGVEHR